MGNTRVFRKVIFNLVVLLLLERVVYRGSFSKVSVAMKKKTSSTMEDTDTEFAAVKTIDKKAIYEGYDSEVLLAREVKALRLVRIGLSQHSFK
jgi:hypothetical protein